MMMSRCRSVFFLLLGLLCYVYATNALVPPISVTRRTRPTALPVERRTRTSDLAVGGFRGGALSLSPEAVRFAETFAPKIGIVSATALYFAPAAAVLAAVRSDEIGDLNPLPLAVMALNGASWLAYGLATGDANVILANIAGAIGSMGYVVGVLPLLKKKSELRMTQGVTMVGIAGLLSLYTFLGLSCASAAVISSTLGIVACGFSILLSGSPLSTIKTVISTQNSASILAPLMVTQVVNTALWTAYGLVIKDRSLWGANSIGLGLGLVQLVFKILFPSKKLAVA